MRITQWGEYGVHFAVYLARQQATPERTIGAQELAESQQIALQYTQQILHRLRDGQIIESVRGPKGGYRLARSAKLITLRDILVAAGSTTFEVTCEKKPISISRCDPDVSCFLRPIWYGLRETVNDYLSRYTLEDLAQSPKQDSVPIALGHRALPIARPYPGNH